MSIRTFSFSGGDTGSYRVVRMDAVAGEPLPRVARVSVTPGYVDTIRDARWLLRGTTSNERYVTRVEKAALVARQPALGRPEATLAALIPIRKSANWWALTQDERRAIFEERAKHLTIGLRYLPAVARRLHHCRDLGRDEPFDFLTWFEYAPSDESAFDELVAELRRSPEWEHVHREIDIRLERQAE